MKDTIAEKLLVDHLVDGTLEPGSEIGLKIDQVLTQDATGTMVYLEYESMGIGRAKASTAVSYVDHNIIQTDSRNADDHRFLQSCAAKFGVTFSPPGNGVSHHVQRQRFGIPGQTLLGSDSHTTTGGCLGMLEFKLLGLAPLFLHALHVGFALDPHPGEDADRVVLDLFQHLAEHRERLALVLLLGVLLRIAPQPDALP